MILGMLAAMAAVWSDLNAENSRQREKIEQLEKRLSEDRKDGREAVHEVKEHVKIIDSNVQIILQKITAMEAERRTERRERGSR